LGSFKALGGAYAVASAARTVAAAPTVVSATDGNHGRSVAWGARRAGCRCVIYLHETVSAEREQAIRALGANIVRTPGNYDDAARACAKDARRMGWVVVSDTAGQGEDERNMALTVMQGYGVMVDELTEQLAAEWPTHVFIQGGCGGLAAAVRAHLATLRGARPQPHFVVVEPAAAACLYLSAVAGEIQTVPGALETVMAGLAVGEPSVPAWEILAIGADAFVTISDEMAVTAMRALADPHGDDAPVVAGETGAAALGALIAVGDDPEARTALGLHSSSRVLLINTESDTDPQIYAGIVGRSAAAVRYGKPRTKETSN
jgi:diaminopropionate ammonia-lyase